LARPAGGGDAHVSTEFVGACVAVEGVGALMEIRILVKECKAIK